MTVRLTVAAVVEGHGEREAVPVLLRRLADRIAPGCVLTVPQPIRVSKSTMVRGGELERLVQLAAAKAGPGGAVLVIVDADDDCAAGLATSLLERARAVAPDAHGVSVIVANREFEAWFIVGLESLRGRRGISEDAASLENAEEMSDAKGRLTSNMPPGRVYRPVLDQPAFAAEIDIDMARRAKSFDKLFREMERLLLRAGRTAEGTASA